MPCKSVHTVNAFILLHFNCFGFFFDYFFTVCCNINQVDLLVARLKAVASPIVADLVSQDNISLRSRLVMDVLLPEV